RRSGSGKGAGLGRRTRGRELAGRNRDNEGSARGVRRAALPTGLTRHVVAQPGGPIGCYSDSPWTGGFPRRTGAHGERSVAQPLTTRQLPTKHLFVTGGVASSLGKGLTASSLGRLLKLRGLRVTMQ